MLMTLEPDTMWHPLDGIVQVEAPTKWSREIVAGRLVESCKVIASSYSPIRSPSNGWPAILREWTDFVGRGEDGDNMRQDVWDSWSRIRPLYDSETLSRAEEAAHWPLHYLHGQEGMCRVVMAWATAKAAGRKIEATFRQRGWAASTTRKRRSEALDKIATGLNARNVKIREAKVGVD